MTREFEFHNFIEMITPFQALFSYFFFFVRQAERKIDFMAPSVNLLSSLSVEYDNIFVI